MATERQSPDAIAAQAGFASCAVTDIDDDPDSPDGLWCVASGNNTNTDVRTTFPTPTGNPTVGADLQEFRVQVRQFDMGQTGTPTARIELWENGALVRAGSDVDVTGSGQVISLPWNANEIATADGSLVECKVVGTKSGGSPGARNTVDVGAVEWNVDYSVGPTIVEGAAVISGAGSVVADGLVEVQGAASLSGSGSQTAAGLVLVMGQASLSGVGGVNAEAMLVIPAAAVLSGVGGVVAAGEIVGEAAPKRAPVLRWFK